MGACNPSVSRAPGLDGAGRHPISHPGPARDFFDGGLLGNGGLGVVVVARPDAVVLHLGHNEVWDQRVDESHAGAVGRFEEVWQRIRAASEGGARAEHDPAVSEYVAAMEAPYRQPYPRPYPCGSLVLGLDRRRAEVLGHEVRVEDGVCRVQLLVDGAIGHLEVLCDQEHDAVWLRWVPAEEGTPAPFDRLRLLPDPDGLAGQEGSRAQEGPADLAEEATATTVARTDAEVGGTADWVSERPWGLAFGQRLPARVDGAADPGDRYLLVSAVATAPLSDGSRPDWYGGRGAFPPLHKAVTPAGDFTVRIDLRHTAHAPAASDGVPAAPAPQGFSDALRAARGVWADYWGRSAVELGDEVLERTWYWNSYFLHCAVRAGRRCPGLFGPWSYRDIGTAWHGDHHMNYNTQQVFWGTFSSNHVDLHLPYVDLVERLLPLATSWARDHYELPGASFPHSAYPVPMNVNPYPVPTWGWEVCETPWTVQSLWWHYTYTGDEELLRSRLLGPLRSAVEFLVAYTSRPGAAPPHLAADGRFHFYPTVVPELYGLSKGLRHNVDSLADITLTRFVCRAYLDAVAVLSRRDEVHAHDDELVRAATDLLERLPELPTSPTEAGPVFVSVAGEDAETVYNVPVASMATFPGEEHGLHSPPEVREVAVRTWRRQRLEGGNELVFSALQGARLGVLDVDAFARQVEHCRLGNGTCTDRVLEQGGRYDDTTAYGFMSGMGVWVENFALPAVVNECLLQSLGSRVRLFPNWPAGREATFHDLRAVGGFLVSATQRDGRVGSIRIRCEVGGRLVLELPWAHGVQVTSSRHVGAGASRVVDGVLTAETVAGEVLELAEG